MTFSDARGAMEYAAFGSVDLEALRWLRTTPSVLEFHLLSSDATLASLAGSKPHGSLALAETRESQWTIKRIGFLHPHVTVRRTGESKDLARLSNHMSHHRIELAGGATYDLKRAGLLVPAWQLFSKTGEELLHIEPVREGRRLDGGTAQVAAAARTLAELPLLLVLTWYFIVLAWSEDEAVSEWTDHVESRF
jgi:hypothetical protein